MDINCSSNTSFGMNISKELELKLKRDLHLHPKRQRISDKFYNKFNEVREYDAPYTTLISQKSNNTGHDALMILKQKPSGKTVVQELFLPNKRNLLTKFLAITNKELDSSLELLNKKFKTTDKNTLKELEENIATETKPEQTKQSTHQPINHEKFSEEFKNMFKNTKYYNF